MIKLALHTEPFWLPLPEFTDLRLKVRPLTTALFALAKARAHRAVVDLSTHLRAVNDAGGLGPDVAFDPDDPVAIDAHLDVAMIKELARAAIVQWEGVFDAGGSPAPVTDRTVGDLMGIFPIGHRFRDAYLLADLMVDAEKNASRPAPDGTSAAGPDTATAAGNPPSPAPAAGSEATATAAPTANTSP